MTAAGIASNTIAKQPASCSASASRADLGGGGGGAALGLPAAEGGRGLGSQADVAHHGDARADDRAGAATEDGPPPSSLTASQPASLTIRIAVEIACSSETS